MPRRSSRARSINLLRLHGVAAPHRDVAEPDEQERLVLARLHLRHQVERLLVGRLGLGEVAAKRVAPAPCRAACSPAPSARRARGTRPARCRRRRASSSTSPSFSARLGPEHPGRRAHPRVGAGQPFLEHLRGVSSRSPAKQATAGRSTPNIGRPSGAHVGQVLGHARAAARTPSSSWAGSLLPPRLFIA